MSKINTEYWGANVSPGSASGYTLHVGLSTNNIRNLIAQGKYNPNTDSFDLSVSPWGIGPSAAGRYGVIGVFRNGSVDGATPGRISKIKFLTDDENRNMPFTLAINPDTLSAATNNTWLYNRINGGIVVDENNYMCNTDYDGTTAGTNLPSGSTTNTYSNIKFPTYLDYSAIRLLISGFYWLNTLTGETGQYSFAASSMSTAKTNWNNWDPANPENIVITGIRVIAIANGMYTGTPSSWGTTPINKTPIVIPLKQHKMNELSYLWNGGGVDDSSKWIGIAPWTIGLQDTYYSIPNYNEVQTGYLSRFIPVDEQRYTSSTTPTLSQVWRYGFRTENTSNPVYSNYSDEKHVFSDVTYRMRPLVWNAINGLFVEFREGQTLSNTRQQLRISSIYDVETSSSDWKNTLMSILLHEVAFYGFPFSIQWQTTNYNNAYAIGSDECYLPVFDEHLVTTGNYMSGAASLELPNATWGNVFDDSMPEYDPTYQPPKPDGGNGDEKDSGDLHNTGGFNKFPSCLTAYAMSLEKFQSVLQSINSMYQTDPDGVKQWELDFKGSNPSDYIIGAYVSVCNFGLSESTYPITIGPVDLSATVPSMVANKILFTDSGYFDCGSVDIEPFYNDFRDYAPYTQLELYLPLCGNVDLDPAYFIGHSVSITYYYDYNTMSCSACIYRDGITLYKVVNGSIGAEIPLTSMRMGDYQNAIHALEQAQKQNEIRMASAMVSMGISAAGLLAAPATGGTSLGLTALGLSGVKSGIETVIGVENINYNIEHKQPAPTQTGASEAQNAFCVGSMYPYLFIKRAKMLEEFDAEIYGHTVGYACNINAHIGDVSGYTVATNIDTSGINATVDEINAIKQAFSKGVYL